MKGGGVGYSDCARLLSLLRSSRRPGHPLPAFTPRVRWMALVERASASTARCERQQNSEICCDDGPLMRASDEGIARERPCPGVCRIGEAKGVRAPCVVARSLPLAYEKNRPGRSQSLRRWPLPIHRVV